MSKPRVQLNECGRRVVWLSAGMLVLVILAVSLGVGLGVGLRKNNPSTPSASENDPRMSTSPSPSSPNPPSSSNSPDSDLYINTTAAIMDSICSQKWPGVVIPIYTAQDFTKRLAYSNSSTVVLQLQNNINGPVWLNNMSYSNTWIVSACGNTGFTILGNNPNNSALRVTGLQNVLILGVNMYIRPNLAFNNCFGLFIGSPCGGLFIENNANNVSLVGAIVQGAVVIRSSWNTTIDSNSITGDASVDNCILLFALGDTKNNIRSNTIIQNNNISNCYMGILGYFGTNGVDIRNNYIANFTFQGIQVDMDVHNMMSAINFDIYYNYIHRPAEFPTESDGSAIYMDTHWYTTNNTIRDNYMNLAYNSYCLYIDYVSSRFQIDRMICRNPAQIFWFKLNTGKLNRITNSAVIYEKKVYQNSNSIGCENAVSNNCLPGELGEYFWQSWIANSWNQSYPYAEYPDLCYLCSQTQINGIPCVRNFSEGNLTANCSGIPTQNHIDVAIVNLPSKNLAPLLPVSAETALNPNYKGALCGQFSMPDALNFQNITGYDLNTTVSNSTDLIMGLNYPILNPDSQLIHDYPSLADFPWDNIGPKQIDFSLYFQGRIPVPV